MSVWLHSLMEALHLAKSLRLTLVEPCVRGGRIIPCTPGKVTSGIPDSWSPDLLVNSTHDPLRLPAYAEDCTPLDPNSGAAPLSGGWAHPLRLYVSLPALRAIYPHIISFDDWARLQLPADAAGATRNGSSIVGRGGGVFVSPLSLCIGGPPASCATNHLFKNAKIRHEAYATVPHSRHGTSYKKRWPAPAGRLNRGLRLAYEAVLRKGETAGSRTLFLAGVGRGFAYRYGTFATPPFNPIHRIAVRAWLRSLNTPQPPKVTAGNETVSPARLPTPTRSFGASNASSNVPSKVASVDFPTYAALQWRSERIPGGKISRCANKIANEAANYWQATERRGHAHHLRVLLADIPAPNSQCAMWSVYRVKSSGNPRLGAVQQLMKGTASSGPLHKYDAHALGVDAGVLSIRDVLLAVHSDSLLGCTQGGRSRGGRKGGKRGSCADCFRASSNYFRWILELRGMERTGTYHNVY